MQILLHFKCEIWPLIYFYRKVHQFCPWSANVPSISKPGLSIHWALNYAELRMFVGAHKMECYSSQPYALATKMDSWRIAVLGDGGVGKTALAVQVSSHL